MTKEKTPFYVCAVKKLSISKNKTGIVLEAFLDKKNFIDARPLDDKGMSKNPWIIKLTKHKNPSKIFLSKQLNIFKKTGFAIIADETHPIRWCGSGALVILEDNSKNRFLVVNKRHPKSVWGNYFDCYGGYSSNKNDMLNPLKLGIREFSEEIKFNTVSKPKIIKSNIRSKIVIHYQNKKYIYKDLNIIIDESTGTIDFRTLVLLKIKNLNDLEITDNETMFISKKLQKRQGRPICLYNLGDIKNMITKKKKSAMPVKVFYENNVIDKKRLKEYKISLSVMTPALHTTLKNAINF